MSSLYAQQERPRIDVVFLLDATGSMGDEIAVIKEKMREMISAIALGEPSPDVRFGIVAYRDRGDEYVTRRYPLTRDIDQTVEDLRDIEAAGGGDYPESLNEGLHVALHDMAWDRSERAARLVFLIADAPPHLDYAQDFDYRDEADAAAREGIVVHTIGASGLDEKGEDVLRHVAATTQGEFQWLAYESRYVDEDGEEVVVRVEGRVAVYTKGDSTWEASDLPPGGLGGAIRTRGGAEAVDATVDAAGEGGGTAIDVTTSTNLDDLITSAIKEAARDTGVDYGPTPSAVEATSWGRVKALIAR
jgi:uncharacterized protein YegL